MNPLAVSVIIPTYNRAHLLPRAVASVLAAAAADDEVLVVDDGSTDATEAALRPFGDRVRYLKIDHSGPGRSRNLGVQAATRPLIAFHDSDDTWLPDRLTLQRTLLRQRPDVLFCFSNFGVRRASGETLSHFLPDWYDDRRPWDEILGPAVPFSSLGELPAGRADFGVHIGDLYPHAVERCYLPAFTLLVRREAGMALHFGENIRFYEDRECFIRLAKAGRCAYLDCDTAWQHEHHGPRVTDVTTLERASCELTVLQRTVGSDPDFLANYRDRYERKKNAQHLLRARCLLLQGQVREARRELQIARGGPVAYRLLAGLPEPLVRGLLAARRMVRR